MRVTRETLIRLAKETAQTRAFENKDIVAAYLFGSLLTEDPFLGGVTDIDLVFVMHNKPTQSREIVKLTGDFHVDITYHARAEYNPARELRVNPWLGPEVYAPMLLYEREKFFDFVQAAVRAGFEFHAPALTLQRCRTLLKHGRGIWTDLLTAGEDIGPAEVAHYLKSIYHAVCAVAELNGNPLAERRLLLDFPLRAEQAERPDMAAALLGLLGGPALTSGIPAGWLDAWQSAFTAAAESGKAEARIHTARLNYYRKAFEAMMSSDNHLAALWPMLNTWTLAASILPAQKTKEWGAACAQLGLAGEAFGEKVEGLDSFLDEVEILLDEIASANGLETSTSF
jgi:predicted nucleotidyltransferase